MTRNGAVQATSTAAAAAVTVLSTVLLTSRVWRPARAHLLQHLLGLAVLELDGADGAQVEQVAAVLRRHAPGVALLGLAAELLSL